MTLAQLNIPQMEPWFGDEETNAVTEYMKCGGWITEFRVTQEFERSIAEYTGAKHCIVVNNGTISLTLAAIAAGVVAGDEVIVPNYTMVATPNSVHLLGATPVFVDVEPETLCLDIEKVEAAITPKTKAIMLVSANGREPKVGVAAFEALCQEKGIALVEDSAQSLGSFYKDGRHVGTAGLVGSFSFSMPKIISTGQGGCLVTNSDEIAGKLRKMKDFGRTGGGNDIHGSIGWNFKFTDVQAAIGVEQMKKLAWRVERKKAIWQRYKDGLTGVKGIKLFDHDLDLVAPWFIDSLCERREGLIAHLKAAGVGSRVMYPPINRQEAYQVEGTHPISELVGEQGLWLPSAAQLTDAQIDAICAAIASYCA
jgi:perosamine synthetase